MSKRAYLAAAEGRRHPTATAVAMVDRVLREYKHWATMVYLEMREAYR